MIDVQRATRWSLEQLAELDDDQILFWWTGGKSVEVQQPRHAVEMKIDKRLTWAENMAKFEALKKEHLERTRGQDR